MRVDFYDDIKLIMKQTNENHIFFSKDNNHARWQVNFQFSRQFDTCP